MNKRQHIWTRLLWKEMREGWQVVLISLIAPVVLFPLARHFLVGIIWRGLLALPAAAGIHIAIALWAANKGGSRKQGAWYLMSQLPVSQLSEWFTSLVVPLAVTALLGVWYGFWAVGIRDTGAPSALLCGALDLATTYAVCYLIAQVISNWAAIIFGAFRLIGGTIISVWTLELSVMDDLIGFVIRTAIGAFVGSFIFAALSQKRSLAFRQGLSLLAVVLIIFAPALKGLHRDYFEIFPKSDKHGPTILSGGQAHSDDWHMEAKEIFPKHLEGKVWFMAGDFLPVLPGAPVVESGRKHGFAPDTQVFLVSDEACVYLLHQRSPKSPVNVIEWDIKTDKLRTVASIKSPKSILLPIDDENPPRMSPDGRYMLFFLKSMIGNGLDLWALDLSSRKCEVVMPALAPAKDGVIEQIGWNGSVATCVMDGGKLARIDFRTMMAKELVIPEDDAK